MVDYKNETAIEFLKRKGRYGTAKDPEWNRAESRHECCGSRRSYYHLKGCHLCPEVDEEE